MTDSLFDQNDNHDDTQFDQNKNWLEELVGEDKKFKSVDDLAKGKAQSDAYIETLIKRQDEMRAEYQRVAEEARAQAKLQDLIDRLEKNQLQDSGSENTPNAREDIDKPTFDPKDIENLILNKINESKLVEKQTQNLNTVMDKLQERFGSNYKTVLKEKANNLGLTQEDIDNLARKSPAAFFNTLGLNEQNQETFNAPPRSAMRNDNFSPSAKSKRTWSYYQELKKSNPEAYLDPKITVQMHKDMAELGEAFKDGDFYAI